MGKKATNIILLKDLLKRGVHIEQASEFKTSIFSDVYEIASQSVEKIVEDNREKKNALKLRKVPQEIGVSNVISFIGRRGTGKSSAMLSFREALDRYNRSGYAEKYENNIFQSGTRMSNICFFSLDYIDASILEESEDIFILVLANMLNYLEEINKNDKEDWDNGYRALLHHFQKIYDDFLTVKESSQYKSGVYSAFEMLINVASSQNIRLQFYNLVQEFLNFVSRRTKTNMEELYLVISIDDLDMARYNMQNKFKSEVDNKAYEIVNSIHKYLSIPGVIVLTAYNHVNLMLQNENFFMNCDTTVYHTKEDRASQRKTSSILANQFVDKAFAASYRVYMPSWKKSDYMESRFKIDALTGLPEEKNLFVKYCRGGKRLFSIKEFMLILYEEKMGIYYDCEGKKIHFLEPDSLRRLSDAITLFELTDLPLQEEFCIDPRRENRKAIFKRIKGDIYFRFVQENLYFPEEKEFFNNLMELRIDRRSEELVRVVSRKTKRLGKAVKEKTKEYRAEIERGLYQFMEAGDIANWEFAIEQINDNRNVKYSFAELVHSIYHMTRDERDYSKELVACILHSYSVHLSELYDECREAKKMIEADVIEKARMNRKEGDIKNEYKKVKAIFIGRYRYDGKSDFENGELYRENFLKIKTNYEIIKGVIGDTICGRWCEYYFPKVYTYITGNRYERTRSAILGYADKVVFHFKVDVFNELSELEFAIKEFVAFSMLFTNVLDWRELKIAIKQSNILDGKFEWEISSEDWQDMELTAFLKYAFCYTEFLPKMERLLLNAIDSDELRNITSESNILLNIKYAVGNVFSKLWNDFVEWDLNYGNMALPIHNFDCVYNLMKHLFQETSKIEDIVEIRDEKDFWREFQFMNNRFRKHLKAVDQFYAKETVERRFENIFVKCPFLQLVAEILREIEDDQNQFGMISAGVGTAIRNLIFSLSRKEDILLPPDEFVESDDL